MDSTDRAMGDITSWLRDADKRFRAEEARHKELLEVHRRGYDAMTRAIQEGFKVLNDLIADGRR
jgi:hypothetical protein